MVSIVMLSNWDLWISVVMKLLFLNSSKCFLEADEFQLSFVNTVMFLNSSKCFLEADEFVSCKIITICELNYVNSWIEICEFQLYCVPRRSSWSSRFLLPFFADTMDCLYHFVPCFYCTSDFSSHMVSRFYYTSDFSSHMVSRFYYTVRLLECLFLQMMQFLCLSLFHSLIFIFTWCVL